MDKPKLIIKDGNFFVTDGEIGGSKFIIKKQPSDATIDCLHELFVKTALMNKNEVV